MNRADSRSCIVFGFSVERCRAVNQRISSFHQLAIIRRQLGRNARS